MTENFIATNKKIWGMQNIITYSPFISFGILFNGIYYENLFVLFIGFICAVLSFFGLLCQCGLDLRDEIEHAKKEDA